MCQNFAKTVIYTIIQDYIYHVKAQPGIAQMVWLNYG